MDSIVSRMEEIEKAANAVVAGAEERKKELEVKMKQSQEEFDSELETKTQAKVQKIRQEVQKRMDQLLEEQEKENQNAIQILKVDFERHHKAYAKEIVERIVQ
jgi:predicted secreted Zn-dependent protease